MSLFNVFNVAGSAMSAQAAAPEHHRQQPGQRRQRHQRQRRGLPRQAGRVRGRAAGPVGTTGVKVREVVEDPSPLKQVYDPKNPLADDKGYVSMPNVNVVDEMVNMLSASRSYQTNVETMNAAKTMLLKTLTIGQ